MADFLTDEEMAALEAQQSSQAQPPGFVSDEQMAAFERSQKQNSSLGASDFGGEAVRGFFGGGAGLLDIVNKYTPIMPGFDPFGLKEKYTPKELQDPSVSQMVQEGMDVAGVGKMKEGLAKDATDFIAGSFFPVPGGETTAGLSLLRRAGGFGMRHLVEPLAALIGYEEGGTPGAIVGGMLPSAGVSAARGAFAKTFGTVNPTELDARILESDLGKTLPSSADLAGKDIAGLTTPEVTGNAKQAVAAGAVNRLMSEEFATEQAARDRILTGEIESANPKSSFEAQDLQDELVKRQEDLAAQHSQEMGSLENNLNATTQDLANQANEAHQNLESATGSVGTSEQHGAEALKPIDATIAAKRKALNDLENVYTSSKKRNVNITQAQDNFDKAIGKSAQALKASGEDAPIWELKDHIAENVDNNGNISAAGGIGLIRKIRDYGDIVRSPEAIKALRGLESDVLQSMSASAPQAHGARSAFNKLFTTSDFLSPGAILNKVGEGKAVPSTVMDRILSSPEAARAFAKVAPEEAPKIIAKELLRRMGGKVDPAAFERQLNSPKLGKIYEAFPEIKAAFQDTASKVSALEDHISGVPKQLSEKAKIQAAEMDALKKAPGSRLFSNPDREPAGKSMRLVNEMPEAKIKDFMNSLSDNGKAALRQDLYNELERIAKKSSNEKFQTTDVKAAITNVFADAKKASKIKLILGNDSIEKVAAKVQAQMDARAMGLSASKGNSATAQMLGQMGKTFTKDKGALGKVIANMHPSQRYALYTLLGFHHPIVAGGMFLSGVGGALRKAASHEAVVNRLFQILNDPLEAAKLKDSGVKFSRLANAAPQVAQAILRSAAQATSKDALKNPAPERKQAPIKLPSLVSEAQAEELPSKKVSLAIHPKLAKAMINQESGGKSDAVSSAGAQGLMQLMPKTGRAMADKLGVAYRPFDPAQNVRLGTEYMKEQIDKFKDLKLALAAYNAGPGKVSRLIKQYGRDFSSLQEHLPRETQTYVKNIYGKFIRSA